MVLVIEGASGSGKSTLVRKLSELTGWPIYRPFRSDVDDHAPGASEQELRTLRVPVNTWMEDLFTADILSKIKTNILLDRSMPSGLAYDRLERTRAAWLNDDREREIALGLWARRIKAASGVIVRTFASSRICAARSMMRFDEALIDEEAIEIERYCRLASDLGITVHPVTTETGDWETRAEDVAHFLGIVNSP